MAELRCASSSRISEPDFTSLALKILGWAVVAIAMLAVGSAGGWYLYAHESTAELAKPKSPGVKKAAVQLKVPVAGQPATARG